MYGDFALKASGDPFTQNPKLKDGRNFTIVRRSTKERGGYENCHRQTLFGLDYAHEGMLVAMIEHPPAFGKKLQSFDASEALKMPGIRDIFLCLYILKIMSSLASIPGPLMICSLLWEIQPGK